METQDTELPTLINQFYYKYILRLVMRLQFTYSPISYKFNSTVIMSSKQFLVLLFGVMLLIITSSWADHSPIPQEVPQPSFEGQSHENGLSSWDLSINPHGFHVGFGDGDFHVGIGVGGGGSA